MGKVKWRELNVKQTINKINRNRTWGDIENISQGEIFEDVGTDGCSEIVYLFIP